MYGRMSLFGAGWPAFGKPCGMRSCGDAVQVRAAVGEQLAEVAVAHRLRVGAREARPGVDLLALHFERGEEEQLVAVLRVAVAEGDRAADVAARILILALRLRRAGDAVRPIVGGEPARRASSRRPRRGTVEVPDLVTPLTFMPPVPYSAAKFELWTFTS